jgi:hypothetical protein
MQKALTILVAALPCYASLFSRDPKAAAVIIIFSTFVGIGTTGILEPEGDLKDKVRLGWLIHIIGIFISITIHNLKP